jgi:hypothetical protein
MISETLSNLLFFGILFGLAIIMLMLAITRKTIIPSVFSMTLWFALSFSVWIFSDPELAFTQVSSILFFGLGITMTIFTVYTTFEGLREAAEERKRVVAEEVM